MSGLREITAGIYEGIGQVKPGPFASMDTRMTVIRLEEGGSDSPDSLLVHSPIRMDTEADDAASLADEIDALGTRGSSRGPQLVSPSLSSGGG